MIVKRVLLCHILVIILISSGPASDAKDPWCSASITVPTGTCCPRAYARYCCSGIPVCADGRNDTVSSKVIRGCTTPWNFTACNGGFYSPDGVTTLACPPGFFCEAYKVCLKPCPIGALCIANELQTGNCSRFQKCCLPTNVAPIFNKLTNTFLCPGQFYPARCPGGNYCPTTTTMFKCPSGYFCREGSSTPVKCPPLSLCGEGETSANTLFGGLIINAILLFLFIGIILSFNNRHALKFYCNLYMRKYTKTRTLSQRYNLTSGLKLALTRLPDFTCGNHIEFEPKMTTYDISFDKLSLKLTSGTHKGKVLLQSVTGKLNAGEVTAVLGPSGAGKTTFLNVLCGKAYYGESGGTIKINGQAVRGIQKYKCIAGFVPQDDIMHRSLTVCEVLYYNALLRLPPQTDPKYHTKMVKKVLDLLGITHIANTQIGDEETRGISGGQRRRVNIGMELVADPSILFLDEPTTGLDSTSSLALVKALNTIASKGNMTVMCVIHQPRFEILRMFDKLIFLGRGGRTVYSGTVEDAETYFASIGFPLPPYVNPADFYMDVISGTAKCQSDVYIDLYQEWQRHQTRVEPVVDTKAPSAPPRTAWVENTALLLLRQGGGTPPTTSTSPSSSHRPKVCREVTRVGPGFFAQLWIFTRREFVLQLHMAKTLLLDQAFTLIGGAVLGLLFREIGVVDIHETTVLADILAGLAAVVPTARRFGQDRIVFWRESASGVNRFSYFVAVNLAYIPVLLISPGIFLSIYYHLTAFLAPFTVHYFVFLCGWFYLSGLGYTLSLMMTQRNAQISAGIIVVIMAMLSGGVPTLCELDDTYVVTAIYNLSFSRWVVEAIFEAEAAERPPVLNDVISVYQIANHYDLETFNICIIALISIGFGLRLIALLLLLFTKRGQQQ